MDGFCYAFLAVYLAIGFVWGLKTIDRRVGFLGFAIRLVIFAIASPVVYLVFFLARL